MISLRSSNRVSLSPFGASSTPSRTTNREWLTYCGELKKSRKSAFQVCLAVMSFSGVVQIGATNL